MVNILSFVAHLLVTMGVFSVTWGSPEGDFGEIGGNNLGDFRFSYLFIVFCFWGGLYYSEMAN